MNFCEWQVLRTGQRICWERAEYTAFYRACARCGTGEPCEGALLCPTHAAVERAENPDLERLTEIDERAFRNALAVLDDVQLELTPARRVDLVIDRRGRL